MSTGASTNTLWQRVESWLNTAGDYLNPILVKETRQALKSRQFVFTFVLLLIACWGITIGGIALLGPGIAYNASGGRLLVAYYMVLLFPLTVVVPFGAFRSLLAEKEENTYDLLTVTTLSPHRIVAGKLASALVQTGVYFSAVAPCLAFTYLLRGVDVVAIVLLLILALLEAVGLAMGGIMLAAVARQKQGQTLISVAFVTGLIYAFGLSAGGISTFIAEGYHSTQETDFGAAVFMVLTAYVCYLILAYFAAVALITFSAANRSTALRWTMMLHQACFVGWSVYLMGRWGAINRVEVVGVGFFWALVYWYIMGTVMTAELPVLSHRVRRGLPQSLLGRATLTWFNPGPGTGYIFAVANLTTLLMLSGGTIAAAYSIAYRVLLPPGIEDGVAAMVVGWGYVVGYLGIGMLMIQGLRRFTTISTLAGFLIHLLLFMGVSGIPVVVQSSSQMWRNAGWTWMQVSNPIWTMGHILQDAAQADNMILLLLIPGIAICVLLICLPGIAREVQQLRVALPQRVVQDEAELHPVVPVATNPWDEPT